MRSHLRTKDGINQSPEYIRTSLAGAMVLGMEGGLFTRGARCTCLNLLLSYQEGCRGACSYCGLTAVNDPKTARTFIRVKWPLYSLGRILEGMKNKKDHLFKRICVAMVTHHRGLKDTCTVIERCRVEARLPVSGLLAPTVMKGREDMMRIRAAGADRVGIAIDAATQQLFDRHRGAYVKGPHRWHRYWESVDQAVDVFGTYMVGVHLVAGLGETEREMVEAIYCAHQRGALTHLFSFYPEKGTLLEDLRQPSLTSYRRIQLARYLINHGLLTPKDITYSPGGRITDFDLDIKPYLNEGLAFMTSGCPGEDGFLACNRPFGNERPSRPIRNYPFIPNGDDIDIIRQQLLGGNGINGQP